VHGNNPVMEPSCMGAQMNPLDFFPKHSIIENEVI